MTPINLEIERQLMLRKLAYVSYNEHEIDAIDRVILVLNNLLESEEISLKQAREEGKENVFCTFNGEFCEKEFSETTDEWFEEKYNDQ